MKSEGQPVDVAPGRVFGDDTGEEPSYQETEKEARDHDREGSCTPMRRGEITDEGEHFPFVKARTPVNNKGMYILICGVTVVKAVRNERKQNTGKELVMHSPILETNSSFSIILQTPRCCRTDLLTKKWP